MILSFKKLLLAICLLFSSSSFAQLNKYLCKQNEKIIFAFQLQNKKWVSICKEKDEKYIVYRFGTTTKMELQYPANLDSTSWKQFTFTGYMRGGGKQNAAMEYAFLNFTNNNVNYEVYKTWYWEDNSSSMGINIEINNKEIKLKGVLKTKIGSLLELMYNDKIKLEEQR